MEETRQAKQMLKNMGRRNKTCHLYVKQDLTGALVLVDDVGLRVDGVSTIDIHGAFTSAPEIVVKFSSENIWYKEEDESR